MSANSLEAIVERCEGCEWILDPANLKTLIRELCAIVESQQEALEYYGDAEKYIVHNNGRRFGVPFERGEKARTALDSTTKRLEQLTSR